MLRTVGVAMAVGLLAVGAHPAGATGRITDRLELGTTRVAAGQHIKGTLVIENPGNAINLTDLARPFPRAGQAPSALPAGCQPGVGVGLADAHYRQDLGFNAGCSGRPFVVGHGTTRIPVTIRTNYETCVQPGGSVTPALAPSTPPCLASDGPPDFGLPPLPTGTYKTQVEWSEIVPLPNPRAVVVTLTRAKPR